MRWGRRKEGRHGSSSVERRRDAGKGEEGSCVGVQSTGFWPWCFRSVLRVSDGAGPAMAPSGGAVAGGGPVCCRWSFDAAVTA